MKHILITSGGTREYIDDVRVLTNISTGTLGAMIAEKFLDNEEDYVVHYVAPSSAIKPVELKSTCLSDNLFIYEVTDVQSVYDKMKELVPQMDVVIHCMAVSDFGFRPCSTKLKSNDPIAFVDSLRERIVKTPKILKEIKVWNSKCKLISFKFEVGLTPEELIEIATKAGLDNHCDLVIANDKKQMQLHKSHIAFAIDPYDPKNQVILYDKNEIADYIYSIC